MLIEPTETEDKQTLDYFIDTMQKILQEASEQPETLKTAPHTMPVKRLDDTKAVKKLNLKWQG